MRNGGFSRHHLIAKSEDGSNHPDNIKVMENVKHRGLHMLHGNSRPIEQLQHTLDINTSTLIHDCKEEIQMVLEFWAEQGREAYHPEMFKKKTTLGDLDKSLHIYM